MIDGKKSVFSISSNESRSPLSNTTDRRSTAKLKPSKRLKAALLSSLAQKSTAIEQARQQIRKLIEVRNDLEDKVKEKDDTIYCLTQELSALNKDHLKALERVKMLERKVSEFIGRNDSVAQEKTLQDVMQKQFIDTHNWRDMDHASPHYFELLQKKNYLQEELYKKLNSIRSKNGRLQQGIEKKYMQICLKRRPINFTEAPAKELMVCYQMIQLQRNKIKIPTA